MSRSRDSNSSVPSEPERGRTGLVCPQPADNGAHIIEVGEDGKLLYVASRWDRLLMLQQLGIA